MGGTLSVVSTQPLPELTVKSSAPLPDSTPKNYGFTVGNMASQGWEGLKQVGSGLKEMSEDILFPKGDSEADKLKYLAHKYVLDPAKRESILAQNAPDAWQSIGHSIAEALPLVGPWAANIGTQAGTGDIGGALARGGTQYLAGSAAGKAVKATGNVLGDVTETAAQRLYQSALKPSTKLSDAARTNVLDTGLREGIPVSPGGVEKLGNLMDDLNQKIADTIQQANRQGATVNKMDVASRLGDVGNKFKTQVNPDADLAAIQKSGEEFVRNNPNQIPIADAQAMKQGTYQQIKNSYGQLSAATVESQKALARGLKEEIASQFPEVGDLNSRESNLIGLDKELERAVGRISNHQLMGIGTPLAAAGAKAISGSTGVAAAAGMLKAIVDDPFVKSKLAIAISKSSGITLDAAKARIALHSGALANAASGEAPESQ
jgi:hypothetical protein